MAKYIIDLKDDECLYKVAVKGSKLDFQKIYEDDMERFEEPEQWRAGYECKYYYLDVNGKVNITVDIDIPSDDWRYNSGNYFRTKEEAEEYRESLLVYNELKAYAESDDAVWDGIDLHWFIVWLSDVKKLIFSNADKFKAGVKLYFPTQEAAEEAVKAVGEERVKRYYLGIKGE